MAPIRKPSKVLLLIAVSSRYPAALAWSAERTAAEFGGVALKSEPFDFVETEYYTDTMGTELKKQFLAFENLIDPEEIREIKCSTNRCEVEYASLGRHAQPRPINLDPGYVSLAKVVLASTKDHAHRLYLGEGIYAEVTLTFRHGAWQTLPWTYPDYQRADYHEFFVSCREILRQTQRNSARGGADNSPQES